ncbi:metallophosphoesterase family protein [Paenibacillus nasutitermitis]|uniref:DeoR family transcriptional regulator n=1 Tax=Paenibacillus nasutitermitis TaxID=1652958 RepID=A0A916Z6Q5_9BACL|nr:metallophosphoesterase family protein [Paenibacillus nasutitermitis]GGD78866.1 DeoR family transcriptional regulator [Paenibacillus nasutitermitis]
MKIAALYDIHGNYPALHAVLKELESIEPDILFIGGDIVSGPMPLQTLQTLRNFTGNVQMIRGNGEREVAEVLEGKTIPFLDKKGIEKQKWVAKQLTSSDRQFLASLPETKVLTANGLGEILFCHATPHSDEEIFTPLTPDEHVKTLFHSVEQPFIFCGHTHLPFVRKIDDKQIINPGSVGMPYTGNPGAYWALIDENGFELKYTSYDLEEASKAILKSGDPEAEEFIENYIKNTMQEDQAINMIEKLAEQRRKKDS